MHPWPLLCVSHADWTGIASGHSGGRGGWPWSEWRSEEAASGGPTAAQASQCHIPGWTHIRYILVLHVVLHVVLVGRGIFSSECLRANKQCQVHVQPLPSNIVRIPPDVWEISIITWLWLSVCVCICIKQDPVTSVPLLPLLPHPLTPPTGLDATSSMELLVHLNKLATTKRTVVLTIHQPRFEIFHMFHKLVLLSDGKVGVTKNLI